MIKRANKPDTPSDIQLQQCLLKKQCFIVVAGAGSGKTTSLIKALKYIDDNHGKLLRQQGKRVACITYTTGAENEINNDVGHDSHHLISRYHIFPFPKTSCVLVVLRQYDKVAQPCHHNNDCHFQHCCSNNLRVQSIYV
jgi:superfamily I DNA/RNA helicase